MVLGEDLWDLRKFGKPVQSVSNLACLTNTKMAVSPKQDLVCAGAYDSRHDKSLLKFYDLDFREVASIYVNKEHITDIRWGDKINQILCGVGEHVKVFFDTSISKKGALQCVNKQPRKPQLEDTWDGVRKIFVPNQLPLFHDIPDGKRQQREEKRLEEEQTKKDHGVGKQGSLRGTSTITQFLFGVQHALPDIREDAQQAILKFEKDSKQNPFFVQNAYKNTQPVSILDKDAPVIAEQVFLSSIKEKICGSCGLKLCTCANRLVYENKKLMEGYDPEGPKKAQRHQ